MMNVDQTPSAAYRIENWIIQPNRNRLVRHGEEARLEPKHMQVLLCLIEHQGKTVSKDELIASVWPEVVVTEHSLNQAISKLRRIFGDDAKHPRIIETISKRGYRLIAPVEKILAEDAARYDKGNDLPIIDGESKTTSFARLSQRSLYVFMPALLILFASVGAMIWLKAPRRDEASAKLAPLTSLPGIERFPAYSPDDRRLAYVHYNPEASRANVLKLLDLSDNTTVELSETPGSISFPCFSPDGKTLAFVTALGCEGAIHTVSAAGGTATKLLNGFSDQIKGLDWSPDGKQLVYADRATKDEPFALFLFSLDTQRRTQLTAPDKKILGDKLPAFSPDGKSIAFARTEANQSADIYLLNVASGEQKRLTHDNALIAGLDWLSDGEHIVYGSSDDMESKLVQISLAEGTTKKLYSSLDHAGVNLTAFANKIAFEYVVYQTGIYKKHFGLNGSQTAAAEIFAPTTRSNWFP
ncbi:MAG: winged helix-turn-helix domain-containing protein, partial [bacterium]